MTNEDPRQILEIEAEAGDEEIRAAYLRKVKQYPPDRAPREFERVRDAYEMLRDPRRRTRLMLLAADPKQPLASLLDGLKPEAAIHRTRSLAGRDTGEESLTDREEILRRFEARLDAALAREDAPRGIPEELLAGDESAAEESTVDRYRMWAALTALTQEVKLQGRTFKQLSDTLGRDNEARSRKEVLDGLLELRERLLRGVEARRRPRKSAAGLLGSHLSPALGTDPACARCGGCDGPGLPVEPAIAGRSAGAV